MKSTVLLRLASILGLLQALAHGFLHVRYMPSHGPSEVALVSAMRSEHFLFGGFARTYWGFYFGYGLMVVLTCVVQACLFWFLADLARSNAARLRPILGLFAFAYLAHGVLALDYFFLKPVIFDALMASLLIAAAVRAGERLVEPRLPESRLSI